MTQEMVRALSDQMLTQVEGWAREERAARTEKRRLETIAKIKELAGAVGVSVTFNGKRGRPPKRKEDAGAVKAGK